MSQRNAAEVLKLRAEIREMSSLPEELAERRMLADQHFEIERLQKDAAEVRQLRKESQQLRTDSEALKQQIEVLKMQQAHNQDAGDQQLALRQERLQKEKALLREYAASLKPKP